MTPTEAIQQATVLGLTLTVRDGMINVAGQRTPEVMALLEQMKPLKPQLISHLTAALEFTLSDVEPLPFDSHGRIVIQREFGKIIAGGNPGEGHYHYIIKPGNPLYQRLPSAQDYKRWIWPKMSEDADVLAELYTIINGAFVGCDVYVDGPHADAVVGAAGYLFNQYGGKLLPILASP
jgi:hypothetical protein